MRNVRIIGIETGIFEVKGAIPFLHTLMEMLHKYEPDIIFLPERWINHVFEEDSADLDIFTDIFKNISDVSSAVFIPGSLSIKRKNGLFNSSPVFYGRKLLGWQDKIVPFGLEKGSYSPGNNMNCFSVNGFSLGIEICYDLNFPFIAKIHAMKGAELILNPSLIRREAIGMWHIYTKARSLENRIPIVSLNSSYEIFSGGSIATILERKRWGVILHSKKARSGIIEVTIDLDRMKDLRKKRALEDPGVYNLGDFKENL